MNGTIVNQTVDRTASIHIPLTHVVSCEMYWLFDLDNLNYPFIY